MLTTMVIGFVCFAANTYAQREDLYIDNISNNRRQQFPRPVILIPHDDHISWNM
jgi:hypothetical protein